LMVQFQGVLSTTTPRSPRFLPPPLLFLESFLFSAFLHGKAAFLFAACSNFAFIGWMAQEDPFSSGIPCVDIFLLLLGDLLFDVPKPHQSKTFPPASVCSLPPPRLSDPLDRRLARFLLLPQPDVSGPSLLLLPPGMLSDDLSHFAIGLIIGWRFRTFVKESLPPPSSPL